MNVNISRIGATVFLNGTRINCTFKGKPSVTGARRVQSFLRAAQSAEGLCHCTLNASRTTKDGLRRLERRSQEVLNILNPEKG